MTAPLPGRGRWLGLDVGERTIGVAVSDPGGLLAQPLETVRRAGWKADLARLAELVAAYEVTGIVVGLPRRLSGRQGPEAEAAAAFAGRLAEGLGLPVMTWDERLTTRAATDALLEADVGRRRRKAAVDAVAAALILQGALDRHRRRARPDPDPDLGDLGHPGH